MDLDGKDGTFRKILTNKNFQIVTICCTTHCVYVNGVETAAVFIGTGYWSAPTDFLIKTKLMVIGPC